MQKIRQRLSHRIGGQNPCHASCFELVFLKQMVELNRLFQKGRGKTASRARIQSPNPTRRPLPYLPIQTIFYGSEFSKDFSGTENQSYLNLPFCTFDSKNNNYFTVQIIFFHNLVFLCSGYAGLQAARICNFVGFVCKVFSF